MKKIFLNLLILIPLTIPVLVACDLKDVSDTNCIIKKTGLSNFNNKKYRHSAYCDIGVFILNSDSIYKINDTLNIIKK